MTSRFDLDGGAVGFVESSSAVPLVSVVVSVRSGAIVDPDGKDGVCRFAARMLRRGADARDLAAGERELELGRRLVAGLRPEQDVDLVEEHDDAASPGLRILRLRELALELRDPLRERSADARTCEDRGRLDPDDDALLEAGDVVAVGDALGERTRDARLADAGPADEACVAPLALREHVEHPLDLGLAADDGIELTARRELGEVLADLGEERELLRIEAEAAARR